MPRISDVPSHSFAQRIYEAKTDTYHVQIGLFQYFDPRKMGLYPSRPVVHIRCHPELKKSDIRIHPDDYLIASSTDAQLFATVTEKTIAVVIRARALWHEDGSSGEAVKIGLAHIEGNIEVFIEYISQFDEREIEVFVLGGKHIDPDFATGIFEEILNCRTATIRDDLSHTVEGNSVTVRTDYSGNPVIESE